MVFVGRAGREVAWACSRAGLNVLAVVSDPVDVRHACQSTDGAAGVVVVDAGVTGQPLCTPRNVPSGWKVVLRGRRDEPLRFIAALTAGAAGFVDVAASPERLITVIREVLLTGVSVGEFAPQVANLARRITRDVTVETETGQRVSLTAREWETLLALIQGLNTREIAEKLFVSPATVRTFISDVKTAFQAEDRSSLMSLAVRSWVL